MAPGLMSNCIPRRQQREGNLWSDKFHGLICHCVACMGYLLILLFDRMGMRPSHVRASRYAYLGIRSGLPEKQSPVLLCLSN